MDSLKELLFSDQSAMRLVGFNARQIKSGVCNRGEFRRKEKEKSGPISPETLATNLVKIPVRQMENFFNNCIKCLAKSGTFPKKVRVAIDGTDIETKKDFPGAGSVVRKKKITDKTGREKSVEVLVHGFKLIALFAIGVKIPIAVKVVQIQRHESQFVDDLVNTAQKNLGRFAKITEFVADRGFLDGETLWWLHKDKNIRFVVPAKDRMNVKDDARKIAEIGGDEVSFKRREKIVVRGSGKNSCEEKIVTEIYGVSELNTYTAYGPPGHGKAGDKESFKANPINAIVITQWENHNYGLEKSKVFVTDMPFLPDPFVAFDA